MKDDTISRQEAIEAFKKELTIGEQKGKYVTICSAVSFEGAKQILEALPAVQSERPKGKWIPKSESGCIIECSSCGERMTVLGDEHPNFCPYCGADMRRKTE